MVEACSVCKERLCLLLVQYQENQRETFNVGILGAGELTPDDP